MIRNLISVIVGAGLLLPACGPDPKPPPAAPAGGTDPSGAGAAAPAPPPPDTSKDKDPSKGNINISEEIRKACGISNEEAYFGYDSALVRQQDQPVLDKLAKCFIDGPLAGRRMRLVGHADPRGDEEYNIVLGGKRAENVKAFVTVRGVSGDRVETSSRGELDATGTDEASWSRDRRVDVMLAD